MGNQHTPPKEDTKKGPGRPKKLIEGASTVYIYTPNDKWRARLKAWELLAVEKMEDIIYGMTLDGASKKVCAEYWDLNTAEFDELFLRIYTLARAELSMRVTKNQIKILGPSKMPLAQAMLGRLFAGQSESASQEVESGAGELTINLRLASKDDSEVQGSAPVLSKPSKPALH